MKAVKGAGATFLLVSHSFSRFCCTARDGNWCTSWLAGPEGGGLKRRETSGTKPTNALAQRHHAGKWGISSESWEISSSAKIATLAVLPRRFVVIFRWSPPPSPVARPPARIIDYCGNIMTCGPWSSTGAGSVSSADLPRSHLHPSPPSRHSPTGDFEPVFSHILHVRHLANAMPESPVLISNRHSSLSPA